MAVSETPRVGGGAAGYSSEIGGPKQKEEAKPAKTDPGVKTSDDGGKKDVYNGPRVAVKPGKPSNIKDSRLYNLAQLTLYYRRFAAGDQTAQVKTNLTHYIQKVAELALADIKNGKMDRAYAAVSELSKIHVYDKTNPEPGRSLGVFASDDVLNMMGDYLARHQGHESGGHSIPVVGILRSVATADGVNADPAITGLVELSGLIKEDPETAKEAARALGEIGGASRANTAKIWSIIQKFPDKRLFCAAATQFHNALPEDNPNKNEAEKALIQLSKSPVFLHKILAVVAIGELNRHNDATVNAILDAAKSPNTETKKTAFEALSHAVASVKEDDTTTNQDLLGRVLVATKTLRPGPGSDEAFGHLMGTIGRYKAINVSEGGAKRIVAYTLLGDSYLTYENVPPPKNKDEHPIVSLFLEGQEGVQSGVLSALKEYAQKSGSKRAKALEFFGKLANIGGLSEQHLSKLHGAISSLVGNNKWNKLNTEEKRAMQTALVFIQKKIDAAKQRKNI